MTIIATIDLFVLWTFLGLLALAAAHDLGSFRIPNRISLAVAMLYPVHVLASPEPVAWGSALLVAGVIFAIGVVLFALRVAGGGDIKLLAATALWAGPEHGAAFLVTMALVGGVMGLLMASKARFGLALALDRFGETELRDVLLADVLPYGLAIAGGGFVVGLRLIGA